MKKVILDVDTGIDDALAIAYGLHSSEIEILGFTTCFGNVSVEEVARNTLFIVEKLGKSVPVFIGANKPLTRAVKENYAKHVHGEDGLGNTLAKGPTGNSETESAVDFMISQVKKHPQEITIISVGPLTNLALVVNKAPEIASLVKEVVIMGGAVYVPGNVTPYGEANIMADPEAADQVFSSGLPITLVGLDVTLKTLLPDTILTTWRELGTEVAEFFAEITEFYMGVYKSFYPGIGGCALHDPLAVGVAINPNIVKTETLNVKVVLEGEETGRTIGNYEGEHTIKVCTQVQADKFLEHFLKRIL
jgi:purine nucleosidase